MLEVHSGGGRRTLRRHGNSVAVDVRRAATELPKIGMGYYGVAMNHEHTITWTCQKYLFAQHRDCMGLCMRDIAKWI